MSINIVTPEDRRVITSLVFVPGRGREGSPEDVLRHFGTTDGHALGLRLIRDAVDRQDWVDLSMALAVCFVFGITMDHLDLLVQLESADWHREHENVVTALSQLRTSAAVDSLYHATQWIPEYLEFDEVRALAVKAIWALGAIPGAKAEGKLRLLLEDPDEIVRENAKNQLTRRRQS